MRKRLFVIPAIIVFGLVLSVVLASNNFFSANNPNKSTPTPTVSSSPIFSPTPTLSPTPVSVLTATPTINPTPSAYAMTINYSEIDRRNIENGTGSIMPIERGVFINIAFTAQIIDGSIRTLIYDDFYVTVNGTEIKPAMQLSGSYVFDNKAESAVWMIFEEIGNDYKLNYRDNSFNIEWTK